MRHLCEHKLDFKMNNYFLGFLHITQISIEIVHLAHQLKNLNCQDLYIIVLKELYFRLHDQNIQFGFLGITIIETCHLPNLDEK